MSSRAGSTDPQVGRVSWFDAPAMRLHAVWMLGVAGCAAASWFEWTRALSGRHEIAWVYAFEWPFFALMGTYLWWKLLHADSREARDALRSARNPRPASADDGTGLVADQGLMAWEAYLARLHQADPPGAPPGP